MNVKYIINVEYGYDNLYPREKYETTENIFYISQVGTFDFDNNKFMPNIGDDITFEFEKEFEIEHDITVGLPVYLKVIFYSEIT